MVIIVIVVVVVIVVSITIVQAIVVGTKLTVCRSSV